MRYSRREIGKMALAGLAVPYAFGTRLLADTRFGGVLIGIQSYSFRTIQDAEAIVAAIADMGFSEVELMSNHAEALAGAPTGRPEAPARGAGRGAAARGNAGAGAGNAPATPADAPRGGRRGRAEPTPEQRAAQQAAEEELRKWRMAATPATWAPVKKKFADAGVELRYLTYNMNVTRTTDEEIEYAFSMAAALGVKAITTSTQVSMAKRVAPFAERHRMPVAFHGHDTVSNPDEVSTEATFEQVLAVSPMLMANLDIGHYTAAGGDPVAFLERHHDRITNLHLKDRTPPPPGGGRGGNLPFGQGTTPIKEVLLLLERTRWDIPANIEFEYGGDPLVEVPKCVEFCRAILA